MARRAMRPIDRVEFHTGKVEEVLPRLQIGGRARLVYADPPFNIGRNYDVVDDKIPLEEYRQKLRGWIEEAYRTLADNGVLVVNIPDQHAAYAVVGAESHGFTLINWCIWHYRFGQNTPSKFISSKVHVLIFRKGKGPHVWNWQQILEPSDRASIYKDRRTIGKADGSPDGKRVPFDVWQGPGFSRITGNNVERRAKHDNQIPIAYIKRVVLAYTMAGDLVVDMFTGSGTLPLVAATLGRRVVAVDISKAYIKSATERVNDRQQQELVHK